MTSRERLLAVLNGEPPDRVPIWLLFPYHRVPYYADVRTNPCYQAVYEASKERAVMLNRRHFSARLWTRDVVERRENGTADGWNITRVTLACAGVSLLAETRGRTGETVVKKMLNSEDDLDQFLALPIETNRAVIERQLDGQLAQYLRERAEFPRDYGAMMLDLGEPIGPLYGRANLTEYPIWSLTRGAEITGWLGRVLEHQRIIYSYCLERDLADVYFLVGSELASPPMVSRCTFQQWIVPFAEELIRLIHAHGKKVIQHYHGQIKVILPDFLTMGPDALHTIEAPPVGNCTLTEAYEIVGDSMALIGNIQYDCFRSYTEVEMRTAVHEVLAEARGRRFILSPTAGPYEETIADTLIRNYLAFMQAGWEQGITHPGKAL